MLANVIAKWLMELPLTVLMLADVIAKWLMELPLQGGGWQML